MRILTIIVSPDGAARVETQGFAGASCRDASRALEQALGSQAAEQLTGEYYQCTTTEQSLPQRQ